MNNKFDTLCNTLSQNKIPYSKGSDPSLLHKDELRKYTFKDFKYIFLKSIFIIFDGDEYITTVNC